MSSFVSIQPHSCKPSYQSPSPHRLAAGHLHIPLSLTYELISNQSPNAMAHGAKVQIITSAVFFWTSIHVSQESTPFLGDALHAAETDLSSDEKYTLVNDQGMHMCNTEQDGDDRRIWYMRMRGRLR